MQEKFTTPEARLDQHQAEMRVSKVEVRVLEASAERYAQIRGRFLENFRTYVVSGAPINPTRGDNTAHEGDAVQMLLYIGLSDEGTLRSSDYYTDFHTMKS